MAAIKTVVEFNDKEIRDILIEKARESLGGQKESAGGASVEIRGAMDQQKTPGAVNSVVTFIRNGRT